MAETQAEQPTPEVEAPTSPVDGVAYAPSLGQDVLHPTLDQYVDVVRTLRERGYAMCADLTATDYLAHPGRPLPDGIEPERFEVVVSLLSLETAHRIRLRVQVADGEPPTAPSLFGIHPGTEAMEREVFDMFGIHFDGHPDLTRILMPEDWEGHPLRKDYSIGRVPVQFKAAPR